MPRLFYEMGRAASPLDFSLTLTFNYFDEVDNTDPPTAEELEQLSGSNPLGLPGSTFGYDISTSRSSWWWIWENQPFPNGVTYEDIVNDVESLQEEVANETDVLPNRLKTSFPQKSPTPDGVPLPPTQLTASDGTLEDGITLSWSTVDNATSYRIWRSTINDPTQALPKFDIIDVSMTSIVDNTLPLKPGTIMEYGRSLLLDYSLQQLRQKRL